MPENSKANNQGVVFTPYYINQERLLDLFAVLNGGYYEYEEIKSADAAEKQKKGSAKVDASAGFRLFNLGGSASGEIGKMDTYTKSHEMRKVQTTASMLGAVIDALNERALVRDVKSAKPGTIAITPVKLKINSIKALIQEAKSLLELSRKMTAFDEETKKNNEFDSIIKQAEQISGMVRELFDAEEVVYEIDAYAIIGSLSDKYLYQATRADIIDVDLTCLAQVKRVFDEGTQLMRNTVFAKFTDQQAKKGFIEALSALGENGMVNYDSIAKTEIVGKPVYQIEIIALYQDVPAQ